MRELINRVQQQLDDNHAVEADDIQALVDYVEKVQFIVNEEMPSVIHNAEYTLDNPAPAIDTIDNLMGWVYEIKKTGNDANT